MYLKDEVFQIDLLSVKIGVFEEDQMFIHGRLVIYNNKTKRDEEFMIVTCGAQLEVLSTS
jgi:hypothetical protein